MRFGHRLAAACVPLCRDADSSDNCTVWRHDGFGVVGYGRRFCLVA